MSTEITATEIRDLVETVEGLSYDLLSPGASDVDQLRGLVRDRVDELRQVLAPIVKRAKARE